MIYVGCNLDLHYLELFLEHAKLDQSLLQALVVKLAKTTILLFKTGRGVITGSTTRKAALQAAKQLITNLNICEHKQAKLKQFKVTNIVLTTWLRGPIDLNKFYNNNKLVCSYEIELFPGLIMRSLNSRVSATFFRKGTYFVTGFSNFKKARTYANHMYELLKISNSIK